MRGPRAITCGVKTVAGIALLFAAGCGDSVTFDPGIDAGSDGAAPYTLRVLTYERPTEGGLYTTARPVAGALAYVRLPGVATVQKIESDADGTLVLGTPDWIAGQVDVTVEAPGFRLRSFVGLKANDEGRTLLLAPAAPRPTIILSGRLENLPAENGLVVVAPTTVGSTFYGPFFGDTYMLEVAKGRPFGLVGAQAHHRRDGGPRDSGWEVLGWLTLTHPGSPTDLQLALDFKSGPLPTRSWGTVELPSSLDAEFAAAAILDVEVSSIESSGAATLGVLSRGTLLDETHFIYELDHLELDTVQEPITAFTLLRPGPQPVPSTTLRRRGYPRPSDRVRAFLDPPALVLPETPFTEPPLQTALALRNTNTLGQLRVTLSNSAGELWTVELPPAAQSITFSGLPIGTRAEEALRASGLRLTVSVCDELYRGLCLREADSGSTRLN